MMNHMSKAMERKPNEKILHRVNGTGNSGRINTHKDVPRGPRSTLAQKLTKPLHNFPIVQPDPNSAITNLDPQQQLALLQIYEQQAKNMAVLLTQAGAMSSNVVPGLSGPSRSQQHGPSLFDRVENRRTGTRGGRERGSYNTRGRGGNSNGSWTQPSSHHTPSNGSADVEMTQDSPLDRPLTAAPTLPSDSACRFGLHCTNAECAYAHQSPAAPPGAPVDPTDSCSFGAACKNKKCTGRHPSPASIKSYQAQQSCKFWPHCANAACPFAHPESRPCRNGADCTVASCSFAHSSVRCKFNPCLNPACVYKHEEGQRRGNFGDKVWVNREGGDGSTSERKFMDEGPTEELIKPEAGGPETNNDTMGTEVMVS